MKKKTLNTVAMYLTYALTIVALTSVLLTSCTTSKGYNYSKHYRKQNVKKKLNHLFDLDNCRKNNHTYTH